MTILVGILISLIGHIAIGLGNCFQKYALMRSKGGITGRRLSPHRPLRPRSSSAPGTVDTLIREKLLQEKEEISRQDESNGSGKRLGQWPPWLHDFWDRAIVDTASASSLHTSDNLLSPGGWFPSHGAYSRFRDRLWWIGIACGYGGEIFGNWIALSLVPASVVTPLGIVGVIVNALLAQELLNEKISRRQRRGYALCLSGVALMLTVATHASRDDIISVADVVAYLQRWNVVWWAVFVLAVQVFLCYHIVRYRQWLLLGSSSRIKPIGAMNHGRIILLGLYVLSTALFGAVVVVSAKFLALFVKCWAVGAFHSPLNITGAPLDIVKELKEEDLLSTVTNPTQSQLFNATTTPLILIPPPSSTSIASYIVLLVFTLLLSVLLMELCKQLALQGYKLTQFQPMFYAAHVSTVTLSGMVVFGECSGLISLAGYLLALVVIVGGCRQLMEMGSFARHSLSPTPSAPHAGLPPPYATIEIVPSPGSSSLLMPVHPLAPFKRAARWMSRLVRQGKTKELSP
ncbi:uncharacterized protein VTP21DRAFT_1349 [Calcarisporiella thermophila]|uniref:uncharacterized protein n=1 Tax=Calcarisporiella thermophila TaxID=911321 RepID=UPI0037439440